jgi:hypothetical protein
MNDFENLLYMLVTNILMVLGSLDPLFKHDLLNGKDKTQGNWERIKIMDDGCCSHSQDMQSPKSDICIKRRMRKVPPLYLGKVFISFVMSYLLTLGWCVVFVVTHLKCMME